ncbi:DNA topoisomerase 2-binding protein 1 [Halotydeus destructor]|nr:DNA topoisomerase 2-binding protein 1 [Halotydeus destructor]
MARTKRYSAKPGPRRSPSPKKQLKNVTTFNFVYSNTVKTDLMEHAYHTLHSAAMDFKQDWIDECDLLVAFRENPESVAGIFVTDLVQGKLFDLLRSNEQCRIFGPLAIIQSQMKHHLPVKRLPVISLSLRDLVVCVSGLVDVDKNELSEKVEMMSGSFCSAYLGKVNCLIADSLTSKKSITARQLGVPIVSPTFVQACWDHSICGEIIDGHDILDQHRLPLFYKLVLSVTQVETEFRDKLSKVSKKFGFRFTRDLKRGEVTHLLCKKPEGEKFRAAKNWGVLTVKTEWFDDSMRIGYALPEDKYILQCPGFQADDTKSKPGMKAAKENIHLGPSLSQLGVVKETPNPLSKSATSRCNTESTQTLPSKLEQASQSEGSTASDQSHSLKEQFHKMLHQRSAVLDGLDFVFVGFSPDDTVFLKKLVSNHSGHYSSKISEHVTHVIVSESSAASRMDLIDLRRQISEKDCNCQVLSRNWLLECFEVHRLVSSEKHVIAEFSEPVASNSKKKTAVNKENSALGFRVSAKSDANAKKLTQSSQLAKPSTNTVIHDDDLLQQYSSRKTTNNLRHEVIEEEITVCRKNAGINTAAVQDRVRPTQFPSQSQPNEAPDIVLELPRVQPIADTPLFQAKSSVFSKVQNTYSKVTSVSSYEPERVSAIVFKSSQQEVDVSWGRGDSRVKQSSSSISSNLRSRSRRRQPEKNMNDDDHDSNDDRLSQKRREFLRESVNTVEADVQEENSEDYCTETEEVEEKEESPNKKLRPERSEEY